MIIYNLLYYIYYLLKFEGDNVILNSNDLLQAVGCLESPIPGKLFCTEHELTKESIPEKDAIIKEPENVVGCSKSFPVTYNTHTAGIIVAIW
jgi:hypothetical protein